MWCSVHNILLTVASNAKLFQASVCEARNKSLAQWTLHEIATVWLTRKLEDAMPELPFCYRHRRHSNVISLDFEVVEISQK